MLLSVLILAGMATDRGQDKPKTKKRRGGEGKKGRWEVEGVGIGEEYVEVIDGGDPLLESTLCLILDHYTYLQGTQGNQKKVLHDTWPHSCVPKAINQIDLQAVRRLVALSLYRYSQLCALSYYHW